MPAKRRPPCTQCGARTALARITPIKGAHEFRIFECAHCGQVDYYDVPTDIGSDWIVLRGEMLAKVVESLRHH